MMLHIPGIIDAAQLKVMQAALQEAAFVDGRLSAGPTARQVKHNEEIDPASRTAADLGRIMVGSLYHNETFRDAALPYRIAAPLFARYDKSMHYGEHIDDPVMGGDAQRFRCDLAVTLFLNDPEDYQGGELLVRTPFGTQQCKFPAGDIVLYPASSLHQVAPIQSGQRLVGVAWIQSMVRDPAKREILFDLANARNRLAQHKEQAEAFTRVDHSYTNLVRMWAEV